MILGYQIRNIKGELWGNRSSQQILTEQTALIELKEARAQSESGYMMVAVVEGDIANPHFENELAACREQYKTVCFSTGHLTGRDCKTLEELALDDSCNMIMKRDTGWFVKLYDEVGDNSYYVGMSEFFFTILNAALAAGFRMVEFDCDADEQSPFKIFE